MNTNIGIALLLGLAMLTISCAQNTSGNMDESSTTYDAEPYSNTSIDSTTNFVSSVEDFADITTVNQLITPSRDLTQNRTTPEDNPLTSTVQSTTITIPETTASSSSSSSTTTIPTTPATSFNSTLTSLLRTISSVLASTTQDVGDETSFPSETTTTSTSLPPDAGETGQFTLLSTLFAETTLGMSTTQFSYQSESASSQNVSLATDSSPTSTPWYSTEAEASFVASPTPTNIVENVTDNAVLTNVSSTLLSSQSSPTEDVVEPELELPPLNTEFQSTSQSTQETIPIQTTIVSSTTESIDHSSSEFPSLLTYSSTALASVESSSEGSEATSMATTEEADEISSTQEIIATTIASTTFTTPTTILSTTGTPVRSSTAQTAILSSESMTETSALPSGEDSTASSNFQSNATDAGAEVINECDSESRSLWLVIIIMALVNFLTVVLSSAIVYKIVSKSRTWDPPPSFSKHGFHYRHRRPTIEHYSPPPSGVHLASDVDCKSGEHACEAPVAIKEAGWVIPIADSLKKVDKNATEDTGV